MSESIPTPKKLLVFGATGVIGKDIVAQLVKAQDAFEKIGIFTSASTIKNKAELVENLKSQGVEVIVGDLYSEEDVKAAYQGFDTVITAVGRPIIQAQILLLRLAEASSTITTFFPSEYGTDIDYSPASATENPHQNKLVVRRYIRENVRKLRITYLVTGPYSDLYISKASHVPEGGTFDVVSKKATLLGTGEDKVSFTAMADVGKLLVAALKYPNSPPRNPRVLKVNSFTTTPNAILAEFEKQTGTKWEVQYTSLEKLKELERKTREAQSPIADLFTLRRIWTEGGTLYEKRDNNSIGDPKTETLEEQVKKAVATQMAAQ